MVISPAFSASLDRASARYQSSASPWQSYAGTGRPKLGSIPTSTLGGAGIETDWRSVLGIPEEEDEDLLRARSRYDTLSAQATALGLEEEVAEPDGFLTKAARAIDYPRALLFSAGKELADAVGGGDDASFDDFRRQLDERMGFGDTELLQYDEEDGFLERAGKAVGAFAGDVIFDPLTYVSLGAGPMGKKAMAGVVSRTVAERAASNLGEDVLTTWAERSLVGRAKAQIAEEVGDEASDNLAESLKTLGLKSAGPNAGAEHVGAAAAEEYLKGGATGVRRFLEGEFNETGRKVFDSLPSDVRGGVRIRVPFSYGTGGRQAGVRTTIPLAGGGGRLQEALGLSGATRTARGLQNRIRASRGAQQLSSALGGTHGDIYGKMLHDLIRSDGDNLTGVTYHQYQALRKAESTARRTTDKMAETTRRTIGMGHHYLDTAPDPQAARDALKSYFQNPAEVRELSIQAGLEIDESYRYFVTGSTEGLSEDQVHGLATAMLFQDTLSSLARKAKQAGVQMGELPDYVIRTLTEEARETKRLRKAGRKPRVGTGGGVQDSTKAREFFLEPYFDEEGAIQLRHLTPDQANARMREADVGDDVEAADLFSTDPFEMMAKYTDGLTSIAYRTNFANMLIDSGAVVKAGTKRTSSMSARKLQEAGNKAGTALSRAEESALLADEAVESREMLQHTIDQIAAAPSMELKLELTDVLAKGLQDSARRLGGLGKITDGDKTAIRKARQQIKAGREGRYVNVDGKLEWQETKAIERAGEATARREVSGEATRAAKALERAAGEVRGARVVQEQVDDLGVELGERDLDRIGSGRGIRVLPPELDQTFAPENFRLAVEKFYRAGRPDSDIQDWVNRVYRPYLSIFKTSATVGRGPGFHVRNMMGGLWNNYMMDVTAVDHQLSAKLEKARIAAGAQARKEQVDEISTLRRISKREATKHVSDDAVEQRAESLLKERLQGVKATDDLSLWDVHVAAVRNQVGWRQGDQSTLSEQQAIGDRLGPDASSAERIRAGRREFLFQAPEGDTLSIPQRGANRLADTWWVRTNGNVAQRVESFMRDAAFIQGLRRYGIADGGETAALLPKASQFDYHDLSEFESRALRGFALPFYTWTRNNIPFAFRSLLTEPGKVNRLMAATGAAQEQWGADDQDYVPEWMRDRLGFATRWAPGGNPFVVGVEAPITQLNDFIKGRGPVDVAQNFGESLASGASPVIKGPLEFAVGKDFFTGGSLDENASRQAPWWYRVLPDAVAPSWEQDGKVRGDARVIQGIGSVAPWLSQATKVAGLAQVGTPEQQGRWPSEAVRQFTPVISAATITPEQEEGMLYARQDRISAVLRRHPEQIELVRFYLEAGLQPEQIEQIISAS